MCCVSRLLSKHPKFLSSSKQQALPLTKHVDVDVAQWNETLILYVITQNLFYHAVLKTNCCQFLQHSYMITTEWLVIWLKFGD